MKKIASLSLMMLAATAFAKGVDDIVPEVEKMAAHPAVVQAVKAQNAKKLTLEKIKTIDADWIAKKGEVPLARELMDNAAAKQLAQMQSARTYFIEAILTDNLGANVAITHLTSDYWQGDEPKYEKAWAGGKGAVYISKPKQDESTGDQLSQVSVPVKDGDAVIGTFTIGVKVNLLH
ncbi:PDC sensor domain-containing protein [Parachitinimonas caeni]|uniref:PDC sensor domain-containing protein n=1 Tax=Parachitinimonas caeni TaxID=3031301 RepID=A0ABT7DTM3_9NEIS|nr:PDC sensor domain-containing protein [Parachitinimonas caeni]MDK2123424.1 PDC sensor domain-containing protein [Parachitinimonas caeni]